MSTVCHMKCLFSVSVFYSVFLSVLYNVISIEIFVVCHTIRCKSFVHEVAICPQVIEEEQKVLTDRTQTVMTLTARMMKITTGRKKMRRTARPSQAFLQPHPFLQVLSIFLLTKPT